MRHKKETKEKVRELRSNGFSLNQIFSVTKTPKTTIRTWIKDIKLSEEQRSMLKDRTHKALQAGRIRAQKNNKSIRAEKEKELFDLGKAEIGKLTPKELFIAGVCLYWAEGFNNKHERRLGFCNSNIKMIKLYLKWLKKSLHLKNEDIVARLTLNGIYKEKVRKIEDYWSRNTGIPLSQFTKPFFQKGLWKRKYSGDNYYGVLRIHAKGSLNEILKMRGWIEGLKDSC